MTHVSFFTLRVNGHSASLPSVSHKWRNNRILPSGQDEYPEEVRRHLFCESAEILPHPLAH